METNIRSLAALAGALALAACGGSSSSGGGGTGAARNTVGAITSVNPSAKTVTVNGKTLSYQGATITEDRVAAGEDRLTTGTVVTVRGSFDDRTGTASEVEIEHGLEGGVDDKGTDFITVAGQRVHVDDSTRFDDSSRLGGISVGATHVKVSGVPDDFGGLRASRVSGSTRTDGGDDVKGFVSNLSGKIFDLRISPDAASCWNVDASGIATLPAGLANGAFVEVRTGAPPSAGSTCASKLVATAIDVEDRFSETEVEIEGIVTSGSSSQFVVDGTTVQTSGATSWRLGAPGDLVVGAKVEAEGSLSNGVLQATKVVFKPGARLTAAIEAVNADSIRMLGMRVQVSTTSFTRNDVGTLTVGERVEVRGNPSADGTGLVAYRITNPSGGGGGSTRVLLRALVTDKSNANPAAPTFTVMGFTVSTSGAQFLGSSGTSGVDGPPISAAAFYDQVEPGHTVIRVRAPSASSVSVANHTFAADEVEIEGKDD